MIDWSYGIDKYIISRVNLGKIMEMRDFEKLGKLEIRAGLCRRLPRVGARPSLRGRSRKSPFLNFSELSFGHFWGLVLALGK